MNPDDDIRIAARGQAAESRDATPLPDGLAEAAAHRNNVVKESERIQEVGFPRGVRADQEHPALEVHIDRREIAPVLQVDVRHPEGPDCWGFHAGSSARASRSS